MRLSTLTPIVALLSSLATAQYDIPSAPFNLVVLSEADPSINGSLLYSCHEGASIEGLCLTNTTEDPSFSTYTHNTSSSAAPTNSPGGATGWLIWVLQGSSFSETETLTLNINPISNVALPLFWPSVEDSTSVAFDSNDLMNIQGYYDDRVVPIVGSSDYVAYYRWYACLTYFQGYTYETLAWALGEFQPENPTCKPVNVKRVFV